MLLGGIDKLRYPGFNFFGSYMPLNKKWMSWAPLEKEVQKLQEDYMNFWIYGITVNTLKLMIKAYFDDGTNETENVLTKVGAIYGELYQIPTGPLNSGVMAINPAKNVIKYELWLTDQADSLISEVRTFRVSKVTHPLTRYFMFLNSLGSYEVLAFKGQAAITTRYQRDIVQKHLGFDYTSNQGEYETNNATSREEGDYSSAHVRGKYAAQW